jgi:hypothetical protein
MLMLAAVIPAMTACEDMLGPGGDPDAPAHVTYELIPNGNPRAPAGVLLSWDVPASGRANSFTVYARNSAGAQWQLRATTTSASFHDAGLPEAQYYVATRDQGGNEIAQSSIVAIDFAPRLPAPMGLVSTSMNFAIHLVWSRNAVDAGPDVFDHYLVYSTAYDDARGVCTTGWVLEGNTVSDAFLVGNLPNGVSRCFAVSAVTHDGHESQWSAERVDTPRPDAKNALVERPAGDPLRVTPGTPIG